MTRDPRSEEVDRLAAVLFRSTTAAYIRRYTADGYTDHDRARAERASIPEASQGGHDWYRDVARELIAAAATK